MRKRQTWFGFGALALAVFLYALPSVAHASKITDDLKATIDQVVEIVKDEKLKADRPARRQRLRETINKRFHYRQMVMRSLAKDWNNRTPQEKEEFVALFRKLLENSYASKIEQYSNEKIEYVDEIVKGQYALVKTNIVRKDATINVDYKLINDQGQWKVYDFVIEGVSMIRNYRSQFTKIIRKESYEGLVKKLTAKIQDLESKEPKTSSEEL